MAGVQVKKVMTRNCELIASVYMFSVSFRLIVNYIAIIPDFHRNARQITAAVDDIFEMSSHVCLRISDY